VDIGAFANGISFRFYGPHSRLREYPRAKAWLGRVGVSLEVLNTRLPEEAHELRRRIEPLLALPRFSTYAVGALVNKCVAAMPEDTTFLHVGLWHGFTFFAGIAGNHAPAVGVDNFSEFVTPDFEPPRAAFLERFARWKGPLDEFYELDYREYFASAHNGRHLGFYFYDGGHAYEHQLRALELAEPHLVPGSLILVDDTNRDDPRRATMAFIEARSGEYALLSDRTTAGNGHPTLWDGFMLIRRR
jgi:Methyltransferase domain